LEVEKEEEDENNLIKYIKKFNKTNSNRVCRYISFSVVMWNVLVHKT
jgi:hypothetical protein